MQNFKAVSQKTNSVDSLIFQSVMKMHCPIIELYSNFHLMPCCMLTYILEASVRTIIAKKFEYTWNKTTGQQK